LDIPIARELELRRGGEGDSQAKGKRSHEQPRSAAVSQTSRSPCSRRTMLRLVEDDTAALRTEIARVELGGTGRVNAD